MRGRNGIVNNAERCFISPNTERFQPTSRLLILMVSTRCFDDSVRVHLAFWISLEDHQFSQLCWSPCAWMPSVRFGSKCFKPACLFVASVSFDHQVTKQSERKNCKQDKDEILLNFSGVKWRWRYIYPLACAVVFLEMIDDWCRWKIRNSSKEALSHFSWWTDNKTVVKTHSPTDAVNHQVIYHAIKCEGAQMGVFMVLTGWLHCRRSWITSSAPRLRLGTSGGDPICLIDKLFLIRDV